MSTALAKGKLQVCVLVKDLEQAMERYRDLLGIEKYNVYVVDTRELPGVTYRGQPGDYRVTVALANVGTWQLELMMPERGESIYKEVLDRQGEGIHHLGFIVNQGYDAAMSDLAARGFQHLQGGPIVGTDRTGRFDYFDSKDHPGIILEVLDIPTLAS
jgi:hypothetical protein